MAQISLWIIAFVMLFNSWFSDKYDSDVYRIIFIGIMSVLAICEAIQFNRNKGGTKK